MKRTLEQIMRNVIKRARKNNGVLVRSAEGQGVSREVAAEVAELLRARRGA